MRWGQAGLPRPRGGNRAGSGAGGQVRASANDLDFYPFDFLKCEFFARAIVEFGVHTLGCCTPDLLVGFLQGLTCNLAHPELP